MVDRDFDKLLLSHFGIVALVIVAAVALVLSSNCAPASQYALAHPEVMESAETALEIAECTEAAIAKHTQRQTKRMLEQAKRKLIDEANPYEADGGAP